MNEMTRRILMRRDGAMDMASRGRSGGNRENRGGQGSGRGRNDGHYPYMGHNMMRNPMGYGRMNDYDYEMGDGRRGVRGSGRGRDYEGGDYMGGYDGNYGEDGRRGVKGSGRYNRRRDRGYDEEYENEHEEDGNYDYGYEEDYGYDYGNDYESGEMRLKPQDMKKWKRELINADGSRGEHFTLEKIIPVAQKHGIRFDEYSEKEFCIVVNMLYSDYCEVNRAYISPENELNYYVKLAKAWLEDDDAPEGKEKLALYYYCIVDADK